MLNNLFINHIRDFLHKEMGIEIYRADDFCDNDIIIETIYNHIPKKSI